VSTLRRQSWQSAIQSSLQRKSVVDELSGILTLQLRAFPHLLNKPTPARLREAVSPKLLTEAVIPRMRTVCLDHVRD
jgi:hypothetical protein